MVWKKLPWEEWILAPAKLSSRVSEVSSAGAAIASWLLTHLVLMLLLLHTNVGFWSPYYHSKGEVGIEAHSSTQQWAEASWDSEVIRKGGQKTPNNTTMTLHELTMCLHLECSGHCWALQILFCNREKNWQRLRNYSQGLEPLPHKKLQTRTLQPGKDRTDGRYDIVHHKGQQQSNSFSLPMQEPEGSKRSSEVMS